jgi:hypothetical protein
VEAMLEAPYRKEVCILLNSSAFLCGSCVREFSLNIWTNWRKVC